MAKPKARLKTATVTGNDYTDMASQLVTRQNELNSHEDEVHEHLHKECAWYRDVHAGKPVAEAGGGCAHTGKVPHLAPSLVFKGTPETPEASTVDKPTVPPGGPGLFHIHGLHLPPYIQHLWFHLVKRYGKQHAYQVAVGVVEKWAEGINPGGWKTKSGKGKKTHADVKAAAAKNVAQWRADIAAAHAHGGDSAALTVALAADANKPAGILTAPGTNMQLQHQPSQTVSPSPPLPPGITLPTQKDCDTAADAIEKDNTEKNPVITGAVRQLRDAGVKLAKGEPVHALQSLRAAQMGVLAGNYELRRNAIPVANVFTVATGVPPAATSSAHSAMAQSAQDRLTFRKHYVAVSTLVDRVRRHYFHGQLGGISQARFSAGDEEKVSKESVNYRPATDAKTCGGCSMFSAGSCTLVEGSIDRSYVCDRYDPAPVKASARLALEKLILSQAAVVD